jgi:hypothetical protein
MTPKGAGTIGGGGGGAAQAAVDALTLLASRVTAPLLASARPDMLDPVLSVMLATARMFPAKDVVEPSVAELPIAKKTLQFCPPLITRTDAPLAVVSVVPI